MCTIICNTLCNSFWRMTVVIVLLSYHLLWLCWIEWFWVLGWLFNNKAICPRIALMNFNLNWDHAVTDSKVITRSQAKEQKSKLSPRTSSFSTEKWESKSVDCNAVCCSMLQCEPSSSSFIICFRVWWNVVQCGARWVMVFHSHHVWWSMLDLLQRVVVCSSVLQCVAVFCKVWLRKPSLLICIICVAVCWIVSNALECVWVCCSMLQHVAACFSMLQRELSIPIRIIYVEVRRRMLQCFGENVARKYPTSLRM